MIFRVNFGLGLTVYYVFFIGLRFFGDLKGFFFFV